VQAQTTEPPVPPGEFTWSGPQLGIVESPRSIAGDKTGEA
jgi:hypothetical protein